MADEKIKENVPQDTQTVDECVFNKDEKVFAYRKVIRTYNIEIKDGIRHKKHVNSEAQPLQFLFMVTREKSSLSKKERLVITASESVDGDLVECGTVIATVPSLQDDILKLREYGVVLPRSAYGVIAKAIEANYLSLTCNLIVFDEDIDTSKIDLILKMCAAYIEEQGIPAKVVQGKRQKCFNIPTDEFTDLIANSEFRWLDIVEVKKGLLEQHYIFVNANRYDRNVEGKKCISFDYEAIKPHLMKGQEN